jgi:hypothetical protein
VETPKGVETPLIFFPIAQQVERGAVNSNVTGSNPVREVMNILFLDDDEFRWNKFRNQNPDVNATWVSSYDAAVDLLKTTDTHFDIAYLDHDLEFYQPTGMDFVKYLVNNKIKIDKVLCHSMNPEGRANMVAMLWGNGYNALNMPWAWEYKVENVLQQF